MADIVMIDETEFTAQELAQANDLVEQIDIFDLNLVLNYGTNPQKKLSESSDKILHQVSADDIKKINETFDSLTACFDSLRSKFANRIRIKEDIQGLTARLREFQLIIMQDMDVLNKILKTNKKYYKEISLYILAGQKRIKQFENNPNAREALDTFKRRLNNLSVSRTVVMQTIAQIELILSTDSAVLERINTVLNVTVPLLKNQLTISNIITAKETIAKLKNTP
ncbi:MAG: toxic anion resistance protein [Clostridia bacterium]|nr:toxic anion resistance protein [Clostridia bacterium]